MCRGCYYTGKSSYSEKLTARTATTTTFHNVYIVQYFLTAKQGVVNYLFMLNLVKTR